MFISVWMQVGPAWVSGLMMETKPDVVSFEPLKVSSFKTHVNYFKSICINFLNCMFPYILVFQGDFFPLKEKKILKDYVLLIILLPIIAVVSPFAVS